MRKWSADSSPGSPTLTSDHWFLSTVSPSNRKEVRIRACPVKKDFKSSFPEKKMWNSREPYLGHVPVFLLFLCWEKILQCLCLSGNDAVGGWWAPRSRVSPSLPVLSEKEKLSCCFRAPHKRCCPDAESSLGLSRPDLCSAQPFTVLALC